MTDTRRAEIFEVFEEDQPASSVEMELMLAYHEHALTRGSPEFAQAEELVEQRRKMRRAKPG